MADTDDSQQWYPQALQDQQDLVDKQERDVVASLPLVQEVLDWFNEQITNYNSPSVIGNVNPSTPAEDVKFAVLLAHGQANEFKKKRREFETQFSRYITEVADAT